MNTSEMLEAIQPRRKVGFAQTEDPTMTEPLVGTLTMNQAREWRVETTDPCAARSLYSMLWPLMGSQVRVATEEGHQGRRWVLIETVVEG